MKRLSNIPSFEVEFDVIPVEVLKRFALEMEFSNAAQESDKEREKRAEAILKCLEEHDWQPEAYPMINYDDLHKAEEREELFAVLKKMVDQEIDNKIHFQDSSGKVQAAYKVTQEKEIEDHPDSPAFGILSFWFQTICEDVENENKVFYPPFEAQFVVYAGANKKVS